jgi:CTP synthase (UTP-ammonia lyase)
VSALIGIVGDFDPAKPGHVATDDALRAQNISFEWLPTESIDGDERLARYDGFWIAPGSPYRSMDGALRAIRSARERGVPLVGT